MRERERDGRFFLERERERRVFLLLQGEEH
jgi:hypothetical protein